MNEPELKESPPSAQPASPRRRRWYIPAAVVVIGLGAAYWLSRGSHASAKSHDATEPVTVAAVKVGEHSLSLSRVFDTEFRPFQEVELYAKVGGFVEKLNVDVGDHVKAGDIIAEIEVPELNDDLEHAQAVERRSEEELKRAAAAHEETHISYRRLADVVKAKPRLVAQQEIDLALAKDHEAEANVEAARNQVAVAKADVKKLQTMLKYSRITAPFDGVVTKRYIDPGALVHSSGGSAPIIRLSENDRLRAVFPVEVSAVSFIKVGDPVTIEIGSLHRTLPAKISRFTRKIESATRTMEVEAEVANPDLTLVPGMYGSTLVVVERHDKALAVPVEAVSRQKTATVWVINAQNEIEERVVSIGIETPSELEILDGVKLNETVMVGSRTQVHAGQHVLAKLIEAKNR